MRELKYDAVAIGNHDLEEVHKYGKNILQNYSQRGQFDLLGMNVHNISGVHKSTIKSFGSVRIGIIGYSTVFNYDINIIATELVSEAKHLRNNKDCRIIILLSHLGVEYDLKLPEKTMGTIDVILGGHSHVLFGDQGTRDTENSQIFVPKSFPYCVLTNDGSKVPVAHAGYHGSHAGMLSLQFRKAIRWNLISATGKAIELNNDIPEHPKMRTVLKPMLQKVGNKYSECLALFKSASNLKPKLKEGFSACRFEPCYTGAVITRAIQLYFDCKLVNKQRKVKTIAILESGSVRSDFPFGNITLGDVMKILPWQNSYNLLRLKGYTIKNILERSMAVYLRAKHGLTTSGAFLQLSGGLT